MSSLANDKKRINKMLKTAFVYFIISIICIGVNRLYAVFAHGVSSSEMTYMFLYPLVGGCAVYSALWLSNTVASGSPWFRLYYNLYNSGIATLTAGSFLIGILEIAGAFSYYVIIFYIIGVAFCLISIIGFILSIIKSPKEVH